MHFVRNAVAVVREGKGEHGLVSITRLAVREVDWEEQAVLGVMEDSMKESATDSIGPCCGRRCPGSNRS